MRTDRYRRSMERDFDWPRGAADDVFRWLERNGLELTKGSPLWRCPTCGVEVPATRDLVPCEAEEVTDD